MYSKWFFIDKAIWNNAFSYDKRKNKKLYVPELIEINSFDEIKFQDDLEKLAFEDFDFDDILSTNYWLKNFYKIKWEDKNIYLFDNHNHAFFFWYLAREEWVIRDNNILVHIDEHADTRDNDKNLLKPDSLDLKRVFNFTNFVLNVGDYIVPAENEWIIWKTIQIRNTKNLEDYLNNKNSLWDNLILNLDLDFFQPDLDFIDYDLKKKVVLDAAKKAKVITICTSPFFINQNLALKVFKDLFS